MRLLLTRPRPQAQAMTPALRAQGWDPVICPLIDIRPIPDAALPLDGVDRLIFTSANGVRAFADLTAERQLPVTVVGPATAEATRDVGFGDVETLGPNADGLAAQLVARGEPGLCLHVRGRDVTADLSASLRAGGVKIRDSIVYAAEAASELPSGVSRQIAEGGFQTAAFYSPRTAKVFASLADPAIRAGLGGTVAVAISQEAQKPLISMGFRRSEVAASLTARPCWTCWRAWRRASRAAEGRNPARSIARCAEQNRRLGWEPGQGRVQATRRRPQNSSDGRMSDDKKVTSDDDVSSSETAQAETPPHDASGADPAQDQPPASHDDATDMAEHGAADDQPVQDDPDAQADTEAQGDERYAEDQHGDEQHGDEFRQDDHHTDEQHGDEHHADEHYDLEHAEEEATAKRGWSWSARLLTFLVVLIGGGALALYGAPKVAPMLPEWTGPLRGWLTPGGDLAKADIEALRAELKAALAEQRAALAEVPPDPGLDARIGALEAAAAEAPDDDPTIALAGRLDETATGLTQRIGVVEGALKGLRTEIEALGAATTEQANETAASATVATDQLVARMTKVEAAMAGLREEMEGVTAANAEALETAVSAMRADLDARVLALKEEAEERIETAEAEAAAVIQAADVAEAVEALRARFEQGGSLAEAVSTLASASGVEPSADLTALAEAGVDSQADLSAQLASLGHQVISTANETEAEGLLGRLGAAVSSSLTGVPDTPTDGDEPPAVLSRVSAHVANADLDAALAEAEALPEEARAVLADWLAAAEARSATGAAIETYIREATPEG